MAKRKLVTLLTDFGRRDPYVAAMKGVLLRSCPDAQIVDISHDLPPHDVLAAAMVLAESAPYFPEGTLHVVVVDPGVGTDRNILAARLGGQTFLVPDNGVITIVAGRLPTEAVHAVVNREHLPPASPSRTFHGRDVFAPVAGRILNGLDIARLGPHPRTFKVLDVPEAREEGGAIVAQVIYVDHFGNLITNCPQAMVLERWDDPDRVRVLCGGRDVGCLQGTYAFVQPGEPVALFNSMELLEVAVNRGRACDTLDAGVGTEVRVEGSRELH